MQIGRRNRLILAALTFPALLSAGTAFADTVKTTPSISEISPQEWRAQQLAAADRHACEGCPQDISYIAMSVRPLSRGPTARDHCSFNRPRTPRAPLL